MKRKILNILVALVMVLGLSLIPAIAMGQDEESTYAGYRLGDGTSGAAEWSVTANYTGYYSAKLSKTEGGTYDSTSVYFVPNEEVTLADFGLADGTGTKEYSWWHKTTGTYYNSQMELHFTAPDGDPDIWLDITAMPLQTLVGTNTWAEMSLVQSTPRLLYYGNNSTTDGDYSWEAGAGGDATLHTVAEIIDAIEANLRADSDPVLEALVLTRVRIELYEADTDKTSYIDDVTIAGTIYDLEPIVMDAAYYKTGDTVTVTVYNGYATGLISGYAYSDTTSVTYPITFELDESDYGFTGSFDLGSDGLLVNDGDTIHVKCVADWGAGSQTLDWGPTATIDDTDPVFTSVVNDEDFYKNEDTITLVVTLDAAGYNVTADFSEIDSGYTADDEVVEDNADNTYTVTYDISEDNTILDEEYTITVTAEDTAGNTAEDDSCLVSLDNTDPAVTDAEADPPLLQPDEEADVTFTANVTEEGSGLVSVTIDLDSIGGADDQAMTYEEDTDLYTYVFEDLSIADEDSYDLTITATDNVGNVNDTAVITLRVVEDVTDPEITSTEVEYTVGYESAREGDDVIVTAVVTDDIAGVDTVTIDATDIGLGAAVAMTLGDDDTYSVTLEVGDVDADTYTLTITATDAAANEATADVTVVVVAELTAYNIDLVEGWNLISTPLIPDDSDIDVVLADITDNVSVVWAYVYDEDGLADWKVWGSGPADLDEIVDGQGYWFEMTADNTLTISGVELPSPPDAPPAYSVYEGWNLIGFKSVDAKTATVYLAGDAYADFVRMYGYDTADVVYTNVLIGDSLQPGQGYWLAVSADGTIYP